MFLSMFALGIHSKALLRFKMYIVEVKLHGFLLPCLHWNCRALVQNLVKGTLFFVSVYALDSQQGMTQVQNVVKGTVHGFFVSMFALDSQQNKAQVQNLIKGTVHGFFVYVFALDSQQSMTQVQNLVKTTLHEFFLKNVKYLKFSKRDLKGQSLDFKKVS